MKTRKKLYSRIIIITLLVVFAIVNVTWFLGRFYGFYKLKFLMKSEKGYNSELELLLDKDGFCYSVKLPTYLYWQDGNLCISSEVKTYKMYNIESELYVSPCTMIIWIEPFLNKVKEVGVILSDDESSRQVYLKNSNTAVYDDDQPYVNKNLPIIKSLFKKAEKEWNLIMPWGK